ncbi:transposase [Bradyrhizobium ivorense]|uniref:transposase n=1 Tax=Bradyrhizobium ivorense TaxID=2511166 RepID=UPI00155A8490
MSAPSSGTRTLHMIEAVADRLEGAPRQLRRRWSDEFKAQVVTEALEPGASVSAIARRIGIHPSQLFAWRRDARAERHYRARHSSCAYFAKTGQSLTDGQQFR